MSATILRRLARVTSAIVGFGLLALAGSVSAQVAPIPATTVGVNYNYPLGSEFTCGGFTPVFTWNNPSAVPGVNFAASGVISGVPTVAGSFPLSGSVFYSGADSPPCVGLFLFARSWTINPAPQILTNALPQGTVGFNYNTSLSATGGTGTLNFALVGSLPPGLNLSPTGVISGVPTTPGTFNFAISAADQVGASTSKPLSITVILIPPVTVGPTTSLPAGTVAIAYSQTFTASGGTGGPYTFTSTGTLPPGLTLASSGTLSGTPTTAGTYSFTILATDAPGPFQGTGIRGYTIVVNAPPVVPPVCSAPTASPAGPVAPGSSINVSASCTNNPTSYSWTANGVALAATTASISANPQVTTTYSVTATNAGGTSSPAQSVTVTVVGVPTCQIAGSPGNPVTPGTAVTMTATCTNNPATFVWTANGVTVGQGPAITQSPQQTTTYALTATNLAGAANASYQVVVNPPPVCSVPTPNPVGPVVPGTTVTVTASCTGNPTSFSWTANGVPLAATAAVITAAPQVTTTYAVTATNASGTSSPPQSVTVTVTPPPASNITNVSGNPPPAEPNSTVPLVVGVTDSQGRPVSNAQFATTVTGGTGTLTQLTPNPTDGIYRFNFALGAGDETRRVGICLSNDTSKCANFAVTTTTTVIVQPAKDVISPQAATAITTPAIQINNIRQRLDQVRLQRSAASSQSMRISMDGQALPPLNAFTLAPGKDGKGATGGGAAADDPFPRWGAFINGDVLIGRQSTVQSAGAAQNGFKLTSKGITLGTDYRFDNNSTLGAAFGYLDADTDLNDNMGTQSADGYSFSVYGSWVPVENAYVDLIANFGHNSYDSERKQLTTTASATSNTSGDQWGVALSAGYSFNQGPLTAIPYARVEYIDAKVDGFTENGVEALTISEQRYKSTTFSIGGQASYSISTSFGVVIPYGRVEFQHVGQSSVQTVYAGVASSAAPASVIPTLGQDKSFGNFAAGVTGIFARNVSAFFNYEQLFSKDNYSQQKYTLGIRVGF